MQCSCGGLMTQQQHTITTTKGIQNWTDKPVALPARIDQNKCTCTRAVYTVTGSDGVIVEKKG